MFTNFFKLAFRNIRKNKAFSTINMLGLTIGLASCILIGLYVFNELSFDHFNHGYARIYRINKITNEKGKQSSRNGITPGQLAPALEQELPDIEHAARFRPWFNDMLVSNDTVRILLKDVAFADAAFMEVFDFPLISGNKLTALTEPFTAVITATTAEKYFGKADPMGKTLITLNNIPVKVTGVSKDPPSQSSLQFSMLISWPTTTAKSTADNFFWMNNWLTQVNFTFIELKEQASRTAVENKVSKILHAHLPEKEYEYSTYLQPLGEIHLG
jgi:putative ABC transport system permease protein